MGEIRALAEEHVRDVADLYLRMMRGQSRPAGKALQDYIREVFFGNPWVSPEIPPLVYCDGGAIVGFLGVIPRPMNFRGRIIRAAAVSQFMVDRQQYRGPAGLELLGHFFRGPQDLCLVDGASEGSHIVWTAAGGHGASLYSFNWLRALRPLGTVRNYVDRAQGALRLAGKIALAAAVPADFLLSKVPHTPFRPPPSACSSRQVTAEELFQCIQELGWREPLKPAYELASFRWLISQAATAPNADLRMATVYTDGGVRCGWYVYGVRSGGPANVLQIGVRRRDYFDDVLSALFADAWRQGASSVKGQAMPQFLVNLTNQHCLFRHPNTSVLFQSRDPALVETIFRGQAALSRLDGECWLRFAPESWA